MREKQGRPAEPENAGGKSRGLGVTTGSHLELLHRSRENGSESGPSRERGREAEPAGQGGLEGWGLLGKGTSSQMSHVPWREHCLLEGPLGQHSAELQCYFGVFGAHMWRPDVRFRVRCSAVATRG